MQSDAAIDVEVWLNRVEAEGECWHWRVAGLDIWPIVKTALVDQAYRKASRFGRSRRVEEWVWEAGLALPYLADAHLKLRQLRARHSQRIDEIPLRAGEDLYFGNDVASRELAGKFLTQPYAALWLERAAEGVPSRQWIEDAPAGSRVARQNWCADSHGVRDAFSNARLSGGHAEAAMPGSVRKTLWQLAGTASSLLPVSKRALYRWLCRLIGAALGVRDALALRLERDRPRMIIMIGGGYWSTCGLVAAARGQGVPTIEVQHGALRPSMDIGFLTSPHHPNTLADVFVGWTDTKGHNPRYVASQPGTVALLQACRRIEPGLESALAPLAAAVRQSGEAFQKTVSQASFRRNVLISHQAFDPLSWLPDFSERLSADWGIWIRMRPNSRPDALRVVETLAARSGRVRWTEPTEAPVAAVLSAMDAHVTNYSAVTLEAAALGIPTLARDPRAATVFGGQRPQTLRIVTDATLVAELEAVSPRSERGGEASILETTSGTWQRIEAAIAGLQGAGRRETRENG